MPMEFRTSRQRAQRQNDMMEQEMEMEMELHSRKQGYVSEKAEMQQQRAMQEQAAELDRRKKQAEMHNLEMTLRSE